MVSPELCPIVALLAVSPHALSAADITAVLHEEEEGPVRLVLALLHESGHLDRVMRKGVAYWSLKMTAGNTREALSVVHRIVKGKQIDQLAVLAGTPVSAEAALKFSVKNGQNGTASAILR